MSDSLTGMSSSDVDGFLARLSSRDGSAAWLARRLLESGWAVRELSGPQQMDVWQLLLARGTTCVRFGIERGRSDGVLVAIGSGAYRPVVEAMSVGAPADGPAVHEPTAVLRWLNQQSDGVGG